MTASAGISAAGARIPLGSAFSDFPLEHLRWFVELWTLVPDGDIYSMGSTRSLLVGRRVHREGRSLVVDFCLFVFDHV